MKVTFNGTGASEGFPALFCECEHCKRVRTMDPINFRMRSSCLIDESPFGGLFLGYLCKGAFMAGWI